MIPIYACHTLEDCLSRLPSGDEAHNPNLAQQVQQIIHQVRTKGDSGLRALAQQFGETPPNDFLLSQDEVQAAIKRLPVEAKSVLEKAAENIRVFCDGITALMQPVALNRNGYTVGMDFKPVECVGCYVPGGRYPLPSTALMTAITAQAAGVRKIAIASPQLRDEVIYAGSLAGVKTFYQIGGAQAVAALAFGTKTIKSVDMVVGPGNMYVTEAKRQLQGIIGIDMLAGPSEVAVIADAQANPEWVAVDMLAQAEHDPEARAYCFTDSLELAHQAASEIERLLTKLELPDFVQTSISSGAIFVLPTLADCVQGANHLAPEHLELLVEAPEALKSQLTHYGALFMGYHATVPFGDYMAGPNHTLPTGRTARFSGGLSPLTFLRPQSWMKPTGSIRELALSTSQFAQMEGLTAHGQAAAVRA